MRIDSNCNKYRIDLHIHTCLSPCADLLMTPGNIIKKAKEAGIDIIAITDHNSAGNVGITMELARSESLKIIPGMEVESSEEVHLLCFFDKLDNLMIWEEQVKEALPARVNDEDFFGYQLLTDQTDNYRAREEQLLATATEFSVREIVGKVTALGGIVIPSHVDRPYNSIIANLGFIPPALEIEIIEISKKGNPRQVLSKYPFLKKYSYLVNSDSHSLNSIKSWTEIYLEDFNLECIVESLKNM